MKFKIVDLIFQWPRGLTGESVWNRIERGLPERAWASQSVLGGWRELDATGDCVGEPKLAPGEMTLSFFEEGLEFRQGALRLLADMGVTSVSETVAWI